MKSHSIYSFIGIFVAVVVLGGYAYVSENAQAQQGVYDVNLVQQDPVFRSVDIPYNWLDYDAFTNLEWLPGGYFLAVGQCNSPLNPGNNFTIPRDLGAYESGGLYAFTENGAYLGKEDVCFRTSVRAPGCHEAGGCTIGQKVLHDPSKANRFVLDADPLPFAGVPRSPLVYEVTLGGIQAVEQLFYAQRNGNPYRYFVDGNTVYEQEGFLNSVDDAAVVGGQLVVTEQSFEGLQTNASQYCFEPTPALARKNKVYSLPWLGEGSELSDAPDPPGDTICRGIRLSQEQFTPIVGVGNFLLASTDENNIQTWRLNLYRIDENGTISFVREFEDSWHNFSYWDVDATDVARIAIYKPAEGKISVYRATNDDLVLDWDVSINESIIRESDPDRRSYISLSGDRVAYVSCREKTRENPSSFPRTYNHCELSVLEQGGAELSVEPLPLPGVDQDGFDVDTIVRGVEFSTGGQIMVIAEPAGTVYGQDGCCGGEFPPNSLRQWKGEQLYLYTIGAGSGGGGSSGNGGGDGSGSGDGGGTGNVAAPTGELGSVFNFVGSYFKELSALFRQQDALEDAEEEAQAQAEAQNNQRQGVQYTETDLSSLIETLEADFRTEQTQDDVDIQAAEDLTTRDVQILLNRDPDTQVAEEGAGSPGNETDFLGPRTEDALKRFQCKHGIVCSGTTLSTGYGNLGPQTRAKFIELYGK